MNKTLPELCIKAHQLLTQNELPQAISLYQAVLEKDPAHQEALHFLGLAYAQSGEIAKAIEALERACALEPQAAIFNNLANAYKQNHQVHEAITHYLKAIALEPQYAQAHNNVANLYALQNQYEQALTHYIKATHAAPDFSQAHFNLGLLLLKNQQLEAAKAQFNNVLTLNPGATEALFYLAVLSLAANELDEAEKRFNEVLIQDSEHIESLVNLGVIALKRNQNQTAVDYFTKALALNNEHVEARNNLAATFMHHDRFENALMHYDVLLKKEPSNQEYLYNSGVAQMALGHLNEATLLFEQVLSQAPQHTPSLSNLAAIHVKLENKPLAQTYLERVLAITPDDKISQHQLHALTGENTTEHIPDYAQNLFNNYALSYDHHMQGTLHYSIPAHISKILHQLPPSTFEKTLDLGCGTGLTGSVLRESSQLLVGVDIAEKMLAHAREKNIYDVLIHKELCAFLQEENQHYNLIIAADVFPYFSDLTQLIALVNQHLDAFGYFIFTTEINETSAWKLEASARFSHAPQYIQELLSNAAFTLIDQKTIPGRLQQQTPLNLMIYVAQKGIVSV